MQQGTLQSYCTEAGRVETEGHMGQELLYALMTIDGENQYSMTT